MFWLKISLELSRCPLKDIQSHLQMLKQHLHHHPLHFPISKLDITHIVEMSTWWMYLCFAEMQKGNIPFWWLGWALKRPKTSQQIKRDNWSADLLYVCIKFGKWDTNATRQEPGRQINDKLNPDRQQKQETKSKKSKWSTHQDEEWGTQEGRRHKDQNRWTDNKYSDTWTKYTRTNYRMKQEWKGKQ